MVNDKISTPHRFWTLAHRSKYCIVLEKYGCTSYKSMDVENDTQCYSWKTYIYKTRGRADVFEEICKPLVDFLKKKWFSIRCFLLEFSIENWFSIRNLCTCVSASVKWWKNIYIYKMKDWNKFKDQCQESGKKRK